MKNKYKTNSEIKSAAKDALIGKYGTVIGAILIYIIIALAMYIMGTASLNPASMFSIVFNRVILFVIEVFFGIFISGMTYMYMNVIYGQPVMVSDMFFGFKQHPDKAILLQLILVLINFATSLPEIVYELYMGSSASNLVSYILMGVGFLLYILLSLAFSQCFYVLHDFPDRSVPEIVRTSFRLMKGSKFRLFRLYLSFIPFILLGFLSLFISFLWIIPYLRVSQAAFYQNLIEVNGQEQ